MATPVAQRTIAQRLAGSPSPARQLLEANARLGRRVGELAALHDVALALTSELRLEPLLEAALTTVASLAAAHHVAIFAARGNTLAPAAHRGSPRAIARARKPAAWVARHHVPLLLPDAAPSGTHAAGADHAAEPLVAVPLLFQERLLGVVCAVEKAGGLPFDERDLRVLICLAPHLAVAIRNATLYANLEARASTAQPREATK